MSAAMTWFQLRFPNLIEPVQFERFLRALHGMSTPGRSERFIVQATGRADGITHSIGVPSARAGAVQAQAVAAMPGIVLEPSDRPVLAVRRAWRIWLSTSRRPLRADDPLSVCLGLLTALASVHGDEALTLQWWLGPVRRPVAVPTRHQPMVSESWPTALATAPVLGPKPLDSEARSALRRKQGEPGWRAVGRIAIQAAHEERGWALLGHLAGALRTVEGPGAALGVRPIRASVVRCYRAPWRWGFAGSVAEFTGLLAWPLGDVGQLPVRRRTARLLPVPRGVPTHDRVLAVDPLHERPIALTARDSLHHLHVLGPTGVGKSTLLLNLIVQDVTAGRAVVVIEPKGDLVADVLARIPAARRDDVVLLDPTDAAPVGLNPLHSQRPELAADQLLHIFAATNPDSWGPRLSDVLYASLLTLARTEGNALPLVPLLLTNARFRRRILSGVSDPLGVGPFWSWFESLSDGERQQVVAPVLNKVRPLVVRPELRAVLGQVTPRFSLREIFTERRILLVDLSKGRLGPHSSRLLGTLLIHQLWQETLTRVQVPAEHRHPVMVVVDEVQDYLGLPTGISEILSQSRGLGVAWTLAHQHLGQLAGETHAAVLANARSRVVFQASAEDAAMLARGHQELRPEDFTQLPAYEAYLRLSVEGGVTPYISGRTAPPPPMCSDAQAVRAASRARYGQAKQQADDWLREVSESPGARAAHVGSRRRPQ